MIVESYQTVDKMVPVQTHWSYFVAHHGKLG